MKSKDCGEEDPRLRELTSDFEDVQYREAAGDPHVLPHTVGAERITNTTLGVPYYNYSILGPKTLF